MPDSSGRVVPSQFRGLPCWFLTFANAILEKGRERWETDPPPRIETETNMSNGCHTEYDEVDYDDNEDYGYDDSDDTDWNDDGHSYDEASYDEDDDEYDECDDEDDHDESWAA